MMMFILRHGDPWLLTRLIKSNATRFCSWHEIDREQFQHSFFSPSHLFSSSISSLACSSLLLVLTRSQYGMFKRPEQSNDKNYSGNPHAMSIIFHFPCYAFICQLEKLFTASSSLVLLTFTPNWLKMLKKNDWGKVAFGGRLWVRKSAHLRKWPIDRWR